MDSHAAGATAEYCLFWFATSWWPLCMAKSEWASWVQAIGSIAAILFAIEIARRQHANSTKLMLEQHRLERQAAGTALVALGSTAQALLRLVHTKLPDVTALHGHGASTAAVLLPEVQQIEDALHGLELQALPANLVMPCVRFRSSVRFVRLELANTLANFKVMTPRQFDEYFTARAMTVMDFGTLFLKLLDIAPHWEEFTP